MMLSTAIAIFLPTLLGFLIITIILRNDKETFFGERIGLFFPSWRRHFDTANIFVGTHADSTDIV